MKECIEALWSWCCKIITQNLVHMQSTLIIHFRLADIFNRWQHLLNQKHSIGALKCRPPLIFQFSLFSDYDDTWYIWLCCCKCWIGLASVPSLRSYLVLLLCLGPELKLLLSNEWSLAEAATGSFDLSPLTLRCSRHANPAKWAPYSCKECACEFQAERKVSFRQICEIEWRGNVEGYKDMVGNWISFTFKSSIN